MTEEISAYDKAVLLELQTWKNPPKSWRSRLANRAEAAVESIAGWLPEKLVEATLGRILPIINRVSRESVPRSLVISAYHRGGHPEIGLISDIAGLTLEQVETVATDHRLREAFKGAAEGGVAGFYGLPAIPADIAALLTLALRSVNHHALLYGFNPAAESERAYALQALEAASMFGPNAKRVSRATLTRLAERLAGKDLAELTARRVLARLPPRIAVRFGAIKSEDAIPVLGAVTGGAFNAWYLTEVAKTARFAYRERFLLRKYGVEVLEAFGL